MDIIDFHTHAFPDAIAERAMTSLEEGGNIKGFTDGTVRDLLRSMDEGGITQSVIASIATRPEQFQPILDWSLAIASARIIPFASVHPDAADPAAEVRAIAAAGLRGIKMHPYYQDFDLDEERLFPLYEALVDTGLLLLMHTGFDLAYARTRKADPVRTTRVVERFPELRLVTSHFLAWEDWEEVERHLLGKPVYTDISYAVQFMEPARARDLILAHPRDYVLFGTDSPWADQGALVRFVRSLDLGEAWERSILSENARRLLGG